MYFASSHMERLESIRDCETSNNMNTLIPYLKTLTPSKVTFISFSQDLKVNIRNESCLFDEFEIGSLEQTLLVYCGTTKDTHYVATITTTNPTETKQLTTFESMRLSREICDIIGYSSSLLKFNTLFNYCPKCGSKMSYAGFGNHQKCVECNNVNFPRTDPCVIVLIKHPSERKCLFVRKSFMPEKICTCVAGFLEVGESLEECAKRECWEEVRLNVSNIKYITSATYPPPLINQIMIGLSADALNDDIDIKPGNELCNAFWVDEEMVKKALKNSCEKQPLDWVSPPASFLAYHLFQHWVDNK